MSTKPLPYEIGKRYYFSLFGVGVVSEIAAGATWVRFDGYRVAFDKEEHHLEIRVG
ncbi:MAG: hypothetical protein KGZ83_07310 [Sulfuricella sp.]|nr:hypothetical protein [Sulfuricella sp.]